jgi:hypothetical protein
VVLMAGPAQRGDVIIRYQQRQAIARDTSLSTPEAQRIAVERAWEVADSAAATNPWLRYFFAYDPRPTIARVRQPLLLLQGATDKQVTPEQADTLAAVARRSGNRQVTLRVLPARNHLLLEDADGDPSGYTRLSRGTLPPDVRGVVADWLVTTLRVGPSR